MSRSNGPIGQQRAPAPQQWQHPADSDLAVQQAYAAAQAVAQGRYPQQGFGNVQGQGQPQYAPPQAPQHPASQQPNGGYYGAPVGQAQVPQQPSYQPVFDRYSPPPEPAQRGYDPRSAQPRQHADQPVPGYAQPPAARAPMPPQPSIYDTHMQAPQQRGGIYDQWPQQPAAAPAPHAPAARSYDFSNYAAAPGGAAQPDYGRMQVPGGAVHQPQPAHNAQHHQMQNPGAAGAGHARAEDAQWQLNAAFDRRDEFTAANHGYAAGQTGVAEQEAYADEATGQLQAATDHGFDPDDQPDYEEDEPRKGRRGLMMVSALVGAIALGGGLAYAYKTFMKPPAGSAQVAKVSAPKSPAKTQPADPGGKQFPNQDSKLQSRLGDGSAQPPAASPDADGVKRVPTVVIGRDGTVSAPAPSAVPGMVVVQSQPAPPVAQAVVAAAPVAPPAAPVQVAAVAPPTAPVAVPQARVASVAPQPRVQVDAVAPQPAAPPKKAAVKKPSAPRDDLVASAGGATTTAAIAPPPAKLGGSGFVAVLASKGSKAEAERTNSELEQKFDVLKGKIFDVQEANLTAQGKGIYYRSVVGPPGSREYANGVCSQLKAAGYAGCWITAY